MPDPDYLELRLGVADRPSPIQVADRSRKETDEPPEPEILGDVPVSISMRDLGVIGVCGEGGGVDALARWLVGQAAVLHAPGDLDVVVLTNAEREQQWGWTRWLPHCRRPGEPVAAVLGTEQQSVSRRLAELGQLIADRSPEDRRVGLPGDATPRPDVLVVVDGARRLRALPGLVTLLREGPGVGITVICLDEDVRLLPEECRAVLDVHEGLVELRRTGSEAVARIRPDLVEASWATRIGRALAPVRDTTPTVEVSGLPSSARLLECIALEDPTPEGVARRWGPEARTDVVIGEGFDGPFRLDIRKDGPHALIAGTTGSGKSELLQTIVASLAVANSPEQLTFVLVDYKGGSAFKDCARLPHTVGMVTDLDTHLVGPGTDLARRRAQAPRAPARRTRRQGPRGLLGAAAARPHPLPTIPRLAIVIDEFASLKAELPDFVTGLVTIAQRGRSLGIHLVLATQRPSGVISNDIRANTNLRIALRVTDANESKDVIDAAESATIGPDQPGRGYARLGHSSLLPFQAGRVGGARPESTPVEDVVREPPLVWPVGWEVVGHPAPGRPKEEGKQTDEGETDLSVLVEAIAGATELRGIGAQHSPWLPELPAPVTLATLRDLVDAKPDEAAGDRLVRAVGARGPSGRPGAAAARVHARQVRPPLHRRRGQVRAARPRCARSPWAWPRSPGHVTSTSTASTAATARCCRSPRCRRPGPSSSAPRSSGRAGCSNGSATRSSGARTCSGSPATPTSTSSGRRWRRGRATAVRRTPAGPVGGLRLGPGRGRCRAAQRPDARPAAGGCQRRHPGRGRGRPVAPVGPGRVAGGEQAAAAAARPQRLHERRPEGEGRAGRPRRRARALGRVRHRGAGRRPR